MAGIHLVPIPTALLLIGLAIALIPLTPVAWIWIIITNIARGARQHEHPSAITAAICSWIGFSIILPWALVISLWLMVMAQLILTPLVLWHQLRNLHKIIAWASTYLRVILESSDKPSSLDETPIPDTSSLPPYTLTTLPTTSPTAIRLLSLRPGPFTAPLTGTITTTTLTANPTYDALSYTRPTDDPNYNTNNNHNSSTPTSTSTQTLYILNPTTKTWNTLPLTPTAATALRRLRPTQGTEDCKVWIDEVCINHADGTEKSRQVSMTDQIFCAARQVVVYTGEGDRGAEGLFEWVNGLEEEELDVPEEVRDGGSLLGGKGGGGAMRGRRWWVVMRGWSVRALGMAGWEGKRAEEIAGELERFMRALRRTVGKVWRGVEAEYRVCALGLPPVVLAPRPENLEEVLKGYFARPWFKLLWALQEVALPELWRVRFICGEKGTTGERILHLATLLRESPTAEDWHVARISRLFRQPLPAGATRSSHLLDLLIETRKLQCGDPKDKIFAILNLARRLDGLDAAAVDLALNIDYGRTVAQLYAAVSAQLIRSHGPGFFLSLVRSSSNLPGSPSWAPDWTAPWPNQRALADTELAGRVRAADEKDVILDFDRDETGRRIMKIMRPRVVRGFFSFSGHVDGAERTHVENVRQLARDEILVEVYPGLTLLLRKERGESELYRFVRACPHAVSREGVERAVARWSRVVVHQENVGEQDRDGSPRKGYLSLSGVYKIV